MRRTQYARPNDKNSLVSAELKGIPRTMIVESDNPEHRSELNAIVGAEDYPLLLDPVPSSS